MTLLHLSILASCINLAAWAIYLAKQWSGAITASPVGWGLSSLMLLSGFFSLWESGNVLIGLSYAVGAIPCFAAFLISIKNSKNVFSHITTSQIIAGLVAAGTFFVTIYNPLYSVYAISLYYLCTYYIFTTALVRGRSMEDWIPWAIWTLSAAINIFVGYRSGADMALALPITSFICWATIACLAFARR